MEIIHIPQTVPNFLFMGCWNKDGCISPAQSAVARKLRKEPTSWPLFLGGDNIYPDKKDGKKTYPVSRVADGLRCLLRDTPRKVYATLGNHNIAKPDVLESELTMNLWTIRKESYCLQFKDRAVVMLNSNPLDEMDLGGEARGVLEALENIVIHFRNTRIPYILLMHHPLISYKKKGFYVMPHHAEVLDRIVAYPPQFILVADTHNYQQGIVKWKNVGIRQVVAGTGGADLDPIAYKGKAESSEFVGEYTVVESAVAHGYTRIQGDNVEFVEVHTSPRSPRSTRRSSKSPRRSSPPKSTRRSSKSPRRSSPPKSTRL